MNKQKHSAFRHFYRRSLVKAKLHSERAFNLGANLPAVRNMRQLVRRVLGKGRAFIRILTCALMAILVMLWEACTGLFGNSAVRFAAFCQAAEEKIHQAYIDTLVKNARRKRGRTPACALLATATILVFSASYFGIGIEVTLNGKSIGYVESRDEVEKLIDEVEERTSGYLGRPYTLSADIGYSLGYVQRDQYLNAESVKEQLFASVDEVSTQYVLSVDGQIVGANASKTALELLKQRILSAHTGTNGNTRAEFVQNITIEQRPVANSYVKTVAEIEQSLKNNASGTQMYAIRQGDTLSQIAQTYGMTLEQVQGLNPQIDPTRIHEGQQIKLADSSPLVSVKTTTRERYTREIAYASEVQYSDALYKNQSKIAQTGANGVADVVADVVSIDGVEQNRAILEWDILSQPQNEIKVIGTKELPAKAAKGYFILPFRGIRSSGYGYRGSEFHTGIDLAGVKGSPVVAADGGTVIFAGWNGNYGNCVIINHGNGLTTLYAHNSALTVKVGQKVAQGEQISKLGSTGRSTGPHCHFEVRINGKHVNPNKYLK